MRIVTYDELPESTELSRAALHTISLGTVLPSSRISVFRREFQYFSEYVGVFALDRDEVIGQAFVLRIPYRFADGERWISGIRSVATRPDFAGRGVARRLMKEVHRLERESGSSEVLLWTNGSWGAHSLYLSLGYVDLYHEPYAVRLPRTRALVQAGTGPVEVGVSGLSEVERFHDETTSDALGFTPRMSGSLRREIMAGELDVTKELKVARDDKVLVGYSWVREERQRIFCPELLFRTKSARETLLSDIESRGRRIPVVISLGFVTENSRYLRRRGYQIYPCGWGVMMGYRLDGTHTHRPLSDEMGIRATGWACHGLDQF